MTTNQKIKILHDAAELIANGEEKYSCLAIESAMYAPVYRWSSLVLSYAEFYEPRGWTEWRLPKVESKNKSLRILLLLNYAESLRHEK